MRQILQRFILLACCITTGQLLWAQTDVTGSVTDAATGEALVGATVTVVRTDNSVTTDAEGRFALEALIESDTLLVSYIGYEEQRYPVGGQRVLTISLTQHVSSMEEVVVVGYGTQTKKFVTGSVASVDVASTQGQPNSNITQVMRGKVAGVQILDNGRPGQDGEILIRGPRSLSGTNDPLIVLDGIIFGGSLSDINPNDIQNMEILKDASAAAIYGSRAANGVILVTSKKGVSEKPVINFNMVLGQSDWGYKMKLFSPERYVQSKLDWNEQAGVDVDRSNPTDYLYLSEAENYNNGIVHDPWKEASQNGWIGSYNLSVSGRSDRTSYFVSGALVNERGLIYNDNSDRITLRTNLQTKITDWLQLGLNTTFARRDISGVAADVGKAYVGSPYGTWYHEDGQPRQYIVEEDQVSGNSMYNAKMTDNEEIWDNIYSNFFAELNIPGIKGLTYRMNFSPNLRWHHNYNFFRKDPYVSNNNSYASKLNYSAYDWVWENILTYDLTIDNNNALDFTLLYGRDHKFFEQTTARADQLSIDALGYNDLSLGAVQTNTSEATSLEGVSSMFRVNYRLMDKYLVTLTGRRDGSSVFARNNKYAFFPSVALAWVMSDEPFVQQIGFVDMAKLRASYGAVGNQGINPYQSLSLSRVTQYVFGNSAASYSGVYPNIMGNDDLKWETTYTTNVALDFEILQQRIAGTIEWYNSKTTDLLVERTIPIMNGYTNILTNIGEVNNRGIEVSLNTINVRNPNFEWSTNIAFSHNKNEIRELYGTDLDGDGREDDDVSNSWFIGHPITSYYDYVFDGIYQTTDTDIPAGSKPGDVRLKDFDGNGVDAGDRRIVGSGGQPKFRTGITNNFSYKQFSLSVFINMMHGWSSNFPLLNTAVSPNAPGRGLNQLDAGYWTEENASNTRPSLVYTNPLKHGWYMSRNFIRIQDITLSYQFKDEVLQRLRLGGLGIYLSAKNLKTFTDWLGMDPESGETGDSQLFPMPRTISAGLSVNF